VYSELGKGSTFKIYFPVATALVDEPTHVSRPSHLITGVETVLFVEDQAEVRRLIIETLHRHGYRVLDAASEDAVEIARDQPVDVLLTDVVLPGSNGREVAKQVVAVRPSARVIYMSGYTDDVIVQHGVLDPGLAFVQKPFTADALLTKIRDVLEATEPPPW